MDKTLKKDLQSIALARKAIWDEPPPEISRLWTKKGARGEGATTLIRATRRLSELATFMHQIRGIARRGGADLETLKIITCSYLEFYADYLGGDYFAMTTLANLLNQAKGVLPRAQTEEDFIALVSELALYASRMDSWVFDFVIPWATFGETFEQVAAARLART